MNIKWYDPLLQTLLVVGLIVLNGVLLVDNFSYYILVSVLLLKVYQIIGGGGVHLWACHGLGDGKVKDVFKGIILFFWVLCGIGRASHFCKYHILHHYYCDVEGDPHSPNDHNVLTLTLGLWTLFTKDKEKYINRDIQSSIDKSYARINSGVMSSLFDKFHYAIIFTTIALFTYFMPKVSLYLITLPMLLNIIDGNFFFVYYFHKDGKVRNTPWVDYWILKSGSHKVHHRWLK